VKISIQILIIAGIFFFENCSNVNFNRDATDSSTRVAGDQYNWVQSGFGACSVTCGGGVSTQTVTCQDVTTNTVAADSDCGSSKPATSETCNPQACSSSVTQTKTAVIPRPQVDIILILDDSESENPDNQKLQAKFSTLLSSLQAANIDWQACWTTTDTADLQGDAGPWSESYDASTGTLGSDEYVLNSASTDLQTRINNVFAYVGFEAASSDERGIAALNMMIGNVGDDNSACFRSGASLATIMVSDEDERSVGGVQALDPAQYVPLQSIDEPSTAVSTVATAFPGKQFVWNSIVVKDATCQAQESSTVNAYGVTSPAFIGTMYEALSNLTGGMIGSICDADYSADITLIKNRIIQTMPSVSLDCNPAANPTITYSPTFTTTTSIAANVISFNPPLPEGTTVTVNYTCAN
jgi:hypothetical protein